MIEFNCTGCKYPISVPDEAAGKTGRCKKCGTANRIPGQANRSTSGNSAKPEPVAVLANKAPAEPQPKRETSTEKPENGSSVSAATATSVSGVVLIVVFIVFRILRAAIPAYNEAQERQQEEEARRQRMIKQAQMSFEDNFEQNFEARMKREAEEFQQKCHREIQQNLKSSPTFVQAKDVKPGFCSGVLEVKDEKGTTHRMDWWANTDNNGRFENLIVGDFRIYWNGNKVLDGDLFQ